MHASRILHLTLLSSMLLGVACRGGQFSFGDSSWNDAAARKRVVKLSGDWKFSVGDSVDWAAPGFPDHGWATIHAPDAWQSEGYPDYNGYAWYRKTFVFPEGHEQEKITLLLGRIDDVDQVYLNGKLIGGTGQFPPHYVSTYDQTRNYEVPAGCLLPGKENVIAVRVYDGGGVGGITDGRLGLFTSITPKSAVALEGSWKFSPGDRPEWKQETCDESGFATIPVPSYWENAGYPNLDGYAWYRKTFTVSTPFSEKTLVLMVGKIDDFDEVYLNGTLIGSTGDLDHPDKDDGVPHYRQNRGYYFPAALLKETNTIAVRVYDHGGYGGIYASPVGIIAQSDYVRYWEIRKKESHGFGRVIRALTDAFDGSDD